MGTEKGHRQEAAKDASIDHSHASQAHMALVNEEPSTHSVLQSIHVDDDGNYIAEVGTEIVQDSTAELSEQESEELLTMTIEDMERMFENKFHMNPEMDLKNAVFLDYFVTAASWGQEHKYNPQQMRQLYTVVHSLLNKIIEERISIVDLMKEFRCLITDVVTDSAVPIEGVKLFNTEQRKAVVSFLYKSLFQHVKLYQYVFSRTQIDETVSSQLTVELPLPTEILFPPYLDEGMPENIIMKCGDFPTPTELTSDEGLRKTFTPDDVKLTTDLEDIFGKLTPEDVRNIVNEVYIEVLGCLQSDTENKMRAHEDNIMNKISKIYQES